MLHVDEVIMIAKRQTDVEKLLTSLEKGDDLDTS